MEDVRRRNRGHPLLRSKKRGEGYNHGFSPSQIQSLAVICQTFLPPETTSEQQAVNSFHVASSTQPPFTDEVLSLYPLFLILYSRSCFDLGIVLL
jgi:long-chain-alcohol oxidase